MAVRTSSPWWLSAILAGGLVFMFAGERAFAHTDGRMLITILGAIAVLVSTGLRAWVVTRAKGRQRSVEFIALLCHIGVVVGLVGYAMTTKWGLDFLGFEDEKAIDRFRIATQVLYGIVLLVSLVPLLMIELVLGTVQRTSFSSGVGEQDDALVELARVREMASSGLSIALAAAFLMVTCNIAEQRNIRKDVSYFKTSSPGTATVNMAKAMTQPLVVYLFFPDINEVGDEVEAYFKDLNSQSGNIDIQRMDRMVSPELAKEHRVSKDGTIVIARGDPEDKDNFKSEKINIDPDIEKARKKELREFDGKVQKALMGVIREKKIAYFSVGHGELNDPDSVGPLGMANPLAQSTLIKELLRQIQYTPKDWDGLGKPVPDDADVLLVLAPRKPLMEEELRAIDEYLARGGSALIALDPEGEATLGALQGRLGVSFNKAILADDKEFMVRTRTVADHQLILTNQFSSHASVTTLSRGTARAGILLVRAGSFEDAPFADAGAAEKPKRTYVVRSMTSTYRDENGNFTYDKDTEKRDRYNIMAAIEDPSAVPEKVEEGVEPQGMRALVIADGEVFSDAMLAQIPLIQALVVDAVKWLGGEEKFAGETKDEKDVRIELTKKEDATWYYFPVIGAPIVVLALGLAIVYLLRRRRRSGGEQ